MIGIFENAKHKSSLYFMCIFLLFFINLMSRVYLFSKIESLLQVFAFAEKFVYLMLAYIIVNKRYSTKQLLSIIIFFSVLLIGYFISKNALFIRGFLIIVAGKGYDYREILILYIKLAISTVLISAFLYILGISDPGSFRRDGISLGTGHPNQLSQIVLFVSLMYILVKNKELQKMDYIIIVFANMIIATLSASRSSIVLIITSFVLTFLYKTIMQKKSLKSLIYVVYVIPVVMLAITVFFAMNYPYSSIIRYIDSSYPSLATFTGRLYLNFRALSMFDVTLFGQEVNLSEGGYTVDNSYIVSILTMGIVPTFIYLLGYFILIRKLIIIKNYWLMSISSVFAIYAFVEASLFDVINFWPSLAILSNFKYMRNLKR